MQKNMIRFFISLGIIFVAYTLIVFSIPFFERNGVFWLAFVFTVLSIVAQLYIQPKAFAQRSSVRSKFYGFPIARVGLLYLAAQIILGLVFMGFASATPIWIAILVFVCLLALAALGLIATDATRDHVEQLEEKLQTSLVSMHSLQSKAYALDCSSDNEQVKTAVANICEKLKYSDPVSSEATFEIENEIDSVIDLLQTALIDKDDTSALTICRNMDGLIARRNRICKLNK